MGLNTMSLFFPSEIPPLLLEHILDNLSQGILIINANQRILYCNAAASLILNLDTEELIGRRWQDIFHDTHLGFSITNAFKGVEPPPYEQIALPGITGQKRKIEVIATFSNQAKAISILLRDVSEWERLKQEETRADRMRQMGEFAAIVAHEVRNPLSSIIGYASLLSQDLEENSKPKKMADQIGLAAENLNHFVQSTLRMTRECKAHVEKRDIISFIKQFSEQLMPVLDNAGQKLYLKVPNGGLFMPFDANLLERALWNLCRNAIEAMQPGGVLTICIEEGNPIKISVSDTGPGISEELQKKLFQPFFTTKENGTGLGLIEVDKIARALGWRLDIESEEQKGTNFVFLAQKKQES